MTADERIIEGQKNRDTVLACAGIIGHALQMSAFIIWCGLMFIGCNK